MGMSFEAKSTRFMVENSRYDGLKRQLLRRTNCPIKRWLSTSSGTP
jgi:hypothetical protein